MWTANFWKEAAERALRTVAQLLVVFIGLDGGGLLSLNWTVTAVALLGAAIASVATSVITVTGPANSVSTITPKNVDGNPAIDFAFEPPTALPTYDEVRGRHSAN
jgi:hypothetical protein